MRQRKQATKAELLGQVQRLFTGRGQEMGPTVLAIWVEELEACKLSEQSVALAVRRMLVGLEPGFTPQLSELVSIAREEDRRLADRERGTVGPERQIGEGKYVPIAEGLRLMRERLRELGAEKQAESLERTLTSSEA